MKYLFLIFFAGSLTLLYSQDLDSLYNEYVKMKRVSSSGTRAENFAPEIHGEKCGFPLAAQIRRNYNKFSREQQASINILSSRPEKQTSIVSSNGYFRVHYNTQGYDAPVYDLNELLAALDSVYNFEINFLGYPAPPTDNMQGGDNLYDVYISNFPTGTYGFTQFEDELPGGRSTSYMLIDNDFANFYTQGINAARVTVAHEFFHAIQIGNYREPFLEEGNNFRAVDDQYYFEISAVAMEEFVFDDINDYYGNLGSYFNRPQRTLSENTGYNLGILDMFFQKRFGFGFLKRIWELMPGKPFLYALEEAIEERGSTIKNEFHQFGVWTFFTGKRARPGYFEEADFYPLIRPGTTSNFNPPSTEMMISSAPMSNYFIRFDADADTIFVLVTNADVYNGVNSESTLSRFDYGLYDSFVSGCRQIRDDYFCKLTSSYSEIFVESVFLNGELVGAEIPEEINEPYPLPFRYSVHESIKIPTNANTGDELYINIYSSGLDLVYDGLRVITGTSGGIVTWNGRDNRNQKLSSGVYIYVVKYGDTVEKGKLVIFND